MKREKRNNVEVELKRIYSFYETMIEKLIKEITCENFQDNLFKILRYKLILFNCLYYIYCEPLEKKDIYNKVLKKEFDLKKIKEIKKLGILKSECLFLFIN